MRDLTKLILVDLGMHSEFLVKLTKIKLTFDVILETWSFQVKSELKITPRFLTDFWYGITVFSKIMYGISMDSISLSFLAVPNMIATVFFGLIDIPTSAAHFTTRFKSVLSFLVASGNSERKQDKYKSISSTNIFNKAYKIFMAIVFVPAMYRIGPGPVPWGIPEDCGYNIDLFFIKKFRSIR